MTKYVRSTDGNNTDDGSTWALAKATIAGATGTAGETIYVSQAHAETQATGLTITFSGTPANPNVVLCGNDAASPPTADATSATVSTTSQAGISIAGSAIVKGIAFQCGNGANYSNLSINAASTGSYQRYEDCAFRLNDTHPSSGIAVSCPDSASGYETDFLNCNFKVTNASHIFSLRGKVTIKGGGYESGTTVPSNVFYLGGNGASGDVRIDGFDFSNLSSSTYLFADAGRPGRAVLNGCKLPASWTVSRLVSSNAIPQSRFELYNSTPSGGAAIPFHVVDFRGTAAYDSTIVKASGSDIGTAKIVTTADAKEANGGFRLFDLLVNNTSTGSEKTATVEFVRDSAANLTNAEIWLEVYYLTTGGKVAMASSRRASPLAAATDCPSSSASWTTTGMATPNKQKIDVSFTPQVAGLVRAVVCVAKASTTVYIDAKLTVA